MLLTIADMARQLQIPEATVRYYRDRFALYVPSVGAGRSRRYPPEALAVLRYVAETLRQGTPIALVEAGLAERFPIVAAPQQDPSSNTAVARPQPTAADLAALFEAALAQREAALRSELARQQAEVLDAIQQQSAAVQQQLAAATERLAAVEQQLRRPWWRRWWRR